MQACDAITWIRRSHCHSETNSHKLHRAAAILPTSRGCKYFKLPARPSCSGHYVGSNILSMPNYFADSDALPR